MTTDEYRRRARDYGDRPDVKEKKRIRGQEYYQRPYVREFYAERKRRRREGDRIWLRVDPWPDECQVAECLFTDRSFVGAWPNSWSETIGHEPPIAWVEANPSHEGPLVLRPEHWACNNRRKARAEVAA